MNRLETFLDNRNLNQISAMNLLQDQGVISDNCINASDVCDSDCDKAVDFLLKHEKEI
jgi:hypothetical protein